MYVVNGRFGLQVIGLMMDDCNTMVLISLYYIIYICGCTLCIISVVCVLERVEV